MKGLSVEFVKQVSLVLTSLYMGFSIDSPPFAYSLCVQVR